MNLGIGHSWIDYILYYNKGSLSTLYDGIDSLISILISVLSFSAYLPILPDNNSEDFSIGTAYILTGIYSLE